MISIENRENKKLKTSLDHTTTAAVVDAQLLLLRTKK
jgi:hypothetical protein